jgi:hypothetical protein
MRVFISGEFWKKLASLSRLFAVSANRQFQFQKRRQLFISDFQFAKLVQSMVDTNCPFQFQKRSQLFIGAHNETLSVAALCVCNPDCATLGIDG